MSSSARCASDYPHHPHDPGFGMWAAPGLLVVLVVAIGIAPMALAGWIVAAAGSAVTGAEAHVKISLWHGFTIALWLSVFALVGGVVLLRAYAPLNRAVDGAAEA